MAPPGDGAYVVSEPLAEPEVRERTGPLRFSYIYAPWKKNDLSQRTVDLLELYAGQVPDAIPAIDNPQFQSQEEGDAWLTQEAPVFALELNGDARAYPLWILNYHEVVNDTVGKRPVVVTYCPLCNTAIVFDREVEGQVRTFGVSGLLRGSNLVMFDRESETWWQQFTGQGLVGELAGKQLQFIAGQLVSWSEFKRTYPQGRVLSQDTGFERDYTYNVYDSYDIFTGPISRYYDGELNDALPPTQRILGVTIKNVPAAYPFSVLQRVPVLNTEVDGEPLVILYDPNVQTNLGDRDIVDGRRVGAAVAYRPVVDGVRLSFKVEGDTIVDRQTGSTWNRSGEAVSGELKGKRLPPVLHTNAFWFHWAAFNPDTLLYKLNNGS